MFKHLLFPTDGSAAAEQAARRTLMLAKEAGARVTTLHVVPPFHVFAYGIEMVEETPPGYEQRAHEQAQRHVQIVKRAGAELGVDVDTRIGSGEHPHEVIIRTAQDLGCDLIVMASHGRRGLKALLLGSETQKVLTHTDLPVLVLR